MNSPEQRENGASAQPERTEPAVSRVSSLEPAIRQCNYKPGLVLARLRLPCKLAKRQQLRVDVLVPSCLHRGRAAVVGLPVVQLLSGFLVTFNPAGHRGQIAGRDVARRHDLGEVPAQPSRVHFGHVEMRLLVAERACAVSRGP